MIERTAPADMTVAIHIGDCRDVLRTLPDESVHCVVTSPPYWGLRDYGTAKWEGGDAACDHKKVSPGTAAILKSTLGPNRDGVSGQATNGHQQEGFRSNCGKCGAIRIDSQIGLEPDFRAYVAAMVGVFREVRRVLRKDGVCWLNLGDSYAGGGHGGGGSYESERNWRKGNPDKNKGNSNRDGLGRVTGLKPKDLCGIPWRVAFALQEDGWWLRSDIIWHKVNPMPESVTDRPTRSHEYLFLLSKSERYYYDNIAIAERSVSPISSEPAWQGEDSCLSPEFEQQESSGELAPFCERKNVFEALSVINQAQASFEETLRQRKTDQDNSTVSSNTERPRKPSAGNSQAPQCDGVDDVRSDGGSMEGDQSSAGQQMRSLRTEKAIDERSYLAAVSGRPTHGNEHSRAMPKLQQPKKQQAALRNRRSVWTIATEPFKESHFAVMPTSLIEPCIKAGTSEKGCCAKCGAPWIRRTEYGEIISTGGSDKGIRAQNMAAYDPSGLHTIQSAYNTGNFVQRAKNTIDWSPSCKCDAAVVPCTVLDPFGGAGTTGLVADRLQRSAILIELNPDYSAMSERRIVGDAPLFADVRVQT